MRQELVLIVDDQEESRTFIVERILSSLGYRTMTADDDSQSIREVVAAHPALIVLNPNVAGLSILRQMQALGALPPLIVCPHPWIETPALEALRIAGQGVVDPMNVQEMSEAIERSLSAGRLRGQCEQIREQFQRRTQQLKILHSIGQSITSGLDHQLILNRLTEAAVYLAGADEGSLLLCSEETGQMQLVARLSQHERRARPEMREVQDRLAEGVLASGEPLILSSQDLIAQRQAAGQETQPLVSLMDVPIKIEGRSVGLVRTIRFGHREFTPDDLNRLIALTHYAALSIKNARLRAEIQEKTERMAICEIGASFGSTLRLDTVLEMVMQVAMRIIDAERGYIALLDQENGTLSSREIHIPGQIIAKAQQLPFGGNIVHQVLASGEPFLSTTLSKAATDGAMERRAVMCMPIGDTAGIVGAIYVDHSDDRFFDDYHQDVLGALCANAAAAVENARLFNQVEVERRRLEAVIRGTDQPVIITDVDGTVLLMNRAAVHGFSTHRGRATGMLLPQVSNHPMLATLYAQARITGQVQHGEIELGTEKTFSATVTPIPEVGFITMMQDVTEFKQLSQLKSEFVATVSHDLRSPLSAVLGFLDVLDQAGPLNAKQEDFVASAQEEVEHLLELTGGLLDLGRLETDIDLPMAPCEMRELVSKTVDHWSSQVGLEKHRLVLHLPRHHLWVRGNAGRLRQVIDNLISNAVKYTPDKVDITITLRQEGTEAVLRVQDAGIGIAPQDQLHVFDRFYRVRNEQTQHIEGSGLGLAIVKSIVERHQGRVWVESELGEGSTFGVVLPILEQP